MERNGRTKRALGISALALACATLWAQDAAKNDVEGPLKEALRQSLLNEDTKVTPGKVRWHASFDEAVAAAKTSRKPVLHFQLLGRLDDEFC